MELFRRLTSNFFFKIILGIVALSFVLFGISGFILGGGQNWVAKIGDSTISLQKFRQALQSNKRLVLANTNSQAARNFVESPQFKSNVLNKLVAQNLAEKLKEEMGVDASKELILRSIARDPNFKNEKGKFDRVKFRRFLSHNGFDEEGYVNDIATNIVSAMTIQTLTMSAPIIKENIVKKANFDGEKRYADVAKISLKNVARVAAPKSAEIEEYYNENRQEYAVGEFRNISYIKFSKKDFAKDYRVTQKEILAKYEANKDSYMTDETRDFYHLSFEDKKEVQDFLKELGNVENNKNLKADFAALAKKVKGKKLSKIKLDGVSNKDLLPEIIEKIFKLEIGELSKPVKSSLGHHLFLLNKINAPKTIGFAKIKKQIREDLTKEKKEKVLQEKIAKIDDYLLTSNSLKDVAKKFGLHYPRSLTIDAKGNNKKNRDAGFDKSLPDFAKNAFSLKEGSVSKIYYSADSEDFYALKVNDIEPPYVKPLKEVRSKVVKAIKAEKRKEELRKLANKIADEIKENPKNFSLIASRYRLKIERNKEFARNFYYKGADGQITAYKNKFLDELFNIEKGEITSVVNAGNDEFALALLKKVKKSNLSAKAIGVEQEKAMEGFRNEILQEYNRVLLAKYPIKINQELLGTQLQ